MADPTATSTQTSPTPASTPTTSSGDQRIPVNEIDPAVTADEANLVADMFSQDFNVQDEGPSEVPGSQAPPVEQTAEAKTEPEVTAPVVSPAAQPEPVVAPQVVPPVATPNPETTAQPVQPAATQTAPSPETVSPTAPIEALSREVEANREVFISTLAEKVYNLTDEEKEAIAVDPGATVPKLMAKSHFNIVQNILGVLGQQLPAMVNAVTEARSRHAALEDKFFAQWPQLDRQKDVGTVMQLAAAFRSANPNADFDTVARMVGAQAVVALGKLPAATPQETVQTQAQRPAPFVPAGNGTPSPAAVQKDSNPFASMFDAMVVDD